MQESKSNPQRVPLANDGARPSVVPAALGFLVADASLKPLFANDEAIAILTYPRPSLQRLAELFQKKVRPGIVNSLDSPANGDGAQAIMKLRSGRRTYSCRAFRLKTNGKGGGPATLFVLERGVAGPLGLSDVSRQFHLTHRQHQAVQLLLQGLSNKEIAENMGISANTVKAFLHMATLRMGVSNRSGILIKILGLLLSPGGAEQPNHGRFGKGSSEG